MNNVKLGFHFPIRMLIGCRLVQTLLQRLDESRENSGNHEAKA
jgi:hypothetical protein